MNAASYLDITRSPVTCGEHCNWNYFWKFMDCIFPRKQNAILITDDEELRDLIYGLFPHDLMEWTHYRRGTAAVEALFNEPPDLLVADNRLPDLGGVEIAAMVKSENVYRQLPVMLCLEQGDLQQGMDFSRVEADDFLLLPVGKNEARSRICLTISRALRSLDANPLSKLPGNTSIIQRIQDLIDRKQDFALAYVDLDYFKSYNDKYGFSRGDEALMMTARVIVNTVRGFGGTSSFVGHVGGDDFVFIMEPEHIETACQRLIATFDQIIPNFYDQDDRERGRIRSTDRQGKIREFPIMAISLAVVFNMDGSLKHYGEASAIAMGLKKKAKESEKSCYVLDRRKTS